MWIILQNKIKMSHKKISIIKNTEENDFIARLIKLFVQIELTITYIQ